MTKANRSAICTHLCVSSIVTKIVDFWIYLVVPVRISWRIYCCQSNLQVPRLWSLTSPSSTMWWKWVVYVQMLVYEFMAGGTLRDHLIRKPLIFHLLLKGWSCDQPFRFSWAELWWLLLYVTMMSVMLSETSLWQSPTHPQGMSKIRWQSDVLYLDNLHLYYMHLLTNFLHESRHILLSSFDCQQQLRLWTLPGECTSPWGLHEAFCICTQKLTLPFSTVTSRQATFFSTKDTTPKSQILDSQGSRLCQIWTAWLPNMSPPLWGARR